MTFQVNTLRSTSSAPVQGLEFFPAGVSAAELASSHLLGLDTKVGVDLENGWRACVCPHCSGKAESVLATLGFQYSLLCHPSGWYHCLACGIHGHFSLNRPPVPLPWWKPLSPEMMQWFQALGVNLETAGVKELLATVGLVRLPCHPQQDGAEVRYFLVFSSSWFKEPQGFASLTLLEVLPSGAIQSTPLSIPGQVNLPWGRLRSGEGALLPEGLPLAKGVVLVDHPLDAVILLSTGLCPSGVLSLPPKLDPQAANHSAWDFLAAMEALLEPVHDFSLVLPGAVGERIKDELSRRLGKEKCWMVDWQKEAEPPFPAVSCLLSAGGREAVAARLSEAKPFPIKGIHTLEDVSDKLDEMYEHGLQPGVSTGWPSVDALYTVKLSQYTIVTGVPSHGKSTWLDDLIVHLAQSKDWSFALFSPENQPIERHYASLTEKYLKAPFDGRNRLSRAAMQEAKHWLNEHFLVLLPEEDDSEAWTIDGVLKLARKAVYRYGVKGVVIDPWNELDHARKPTITETDHISESLSKIRRFARHHDVHVFLVAHPTKLRRGMDGKYPIPTLYDISGCHVAGTEVLTTKGWNLHQNVTTRDLVACFAPASGKLAWRHPKHCHVYDYKGPLWRLNTGLSDALVTPQHRLVVRSGEDRSWSLQEAEELYEALLAGQSCQLPGGSQWHGQGTSRAQVIHHTWVEELLAAGGIGIPGHLPLTSNASALNRLVILFQGAEPAVLSGFISALCHRAGFLHGWWVRDRRLADGLQIAALRSGFWAALTPGSGGSFWLDIRALPVLPLSVKDWSPVKHYTGKVYCLTVPGSAYLTRYHGRPGIYGNSGHWYNKADNGITIYRNVGEADETITDVYVRKVRFREVGHAGVVSLRFDRETGCYVDDIDQAARASVRSTGQIVDPSLLIRQDDSEPLGSNEWPI